MCYHQLDCFFIGLQPALAYFPAQNILIYLNASPLTCLSGILRNPKGCMWASMCERTCEPNNLSYETCFGENR